MLLPTSTRPSSPGKASSKWARRVILSALPPNVRLGANRVMRSRDGQLMLLLLLALSLGTGGVLWLHAGLEPERCDDEHSE